MSFFISVSTLLFSKITDQSIYDNYLYLFLEEEEELTELELLDKEYLTNMINRLIKNLPLNQRKIINLKYSKGLEHKEISKKLNMNIKKVIKIEKSALNKLRSQIRNIINSQKIECDPYQLAA